MAETNATKTDAQGRPFNAWEAAFGTVNNAIGAYAGVQTAKVVAKAPVKNAALIVVGILGLGVLMVFVLKR